MTRAKCHDNKNSESSNRVSDQGLGQIFACQRLSRVEVEEILISRRLLLPNPSEPMSNLVLHSVALWLVLETLGLFRSLARSIHPRPGLKTGFRCLSVVDFPSRVESLKGAFSLILAGVPSSSLFLPPPLNRRPKRGSDPASEGDPCGSPGLA
ncbi:hypothetical protein VTI74DRAFT_4879 [Chaetomium olivicolor]